LQGGAEVEFLTQGEKLKRLRIQLNLRQKDLADENITREFISMVEKDKRNFSKQNAISIMKNILSKAEEKGIVLNLDEEYIYRDIKQDVQKYCLQQVENKATKEECEKLLDMAEKYDLPYAKFRILKRMGKIFFADQDYTQSFIIHSQAMEILNTNNLIEEKPIIFNNMGVCKLKLTQYEEAVLYFSNSLIICDIINDYKICNRVLFNLALTYDNLGKVDETLKVIQKCNKKLDKIKENILYLKVKVMEANCYEVKKQYDKSFIIYDQLINDIRNNQNPENFKFLGLIYNNMAFIKLEQKNYDESEFYFDKSYQARLIYDKEGLSHTLIDKSSLYIDVNLLDKAIEGINEGIIICKKYNDYEYWLTGLKQLEKIYLIKKNYDKLEKVYLDLMSLSEKNNTEKNSIYALNKLINLELLLKNMEKAQFYSNKLNEYIEYSIKV